MNQPSLNLNEALCLPATGLPCLVLVHLKWFWLGFRLFIASPQINVDPRVWVLKSTTCFLMRCQGDTQPEQRTCRPVLPRCRGESSPTIDFFSPLPKLTSNAASEKTIFFMDKHKHVFSTSVRWRGKKKKKETEGGKIIRPETHFSLCEWQGLVLENQYCLISLYGQPMSGSDKTLRSVKPHNCNVFQGFGIMSKKWWEPATVHSCSLIFMNNCLLWMLAIPLTFISLPQRLPKCLLAYGLNNTRETGCPAISIDFCMPEKAMIMPLNI